MLQIISGVSGSGKTTAVTDIICDLCEKGENKLLVLVPDQSSFETETAFLNRLGARLSRNILVFGFSRLCEYVFKNTGHIAQNVIDDGVRRILMSKAIEQSQDRLRLYSASHRSVLDLMLHSLQECRKDNISTEMLRSARDRVDGEILRQKLDETALVLDVYDALLSDSRIDPLEDLTRLKNILLDSDLFSDYTIAVDSFSGFTRQQLDIIELLMNRSRDFYITLNINISERDSEIFATTNRTRKVIKRIAAANRTERKPDMVLGGFRRSNRDDISFLEKYILRLDDAVYEKHADNIETYVADNIYGEVDFVARKIKELVIKQGCRYSDIAVVNRDSSAYVGILDTVFEKYGIPYYMGIPNDVFTKPVVRFICCAVDCVLSGFDRENLLSMLKTGLAGLSEEQIADFENYLYIWNIDRSALKRPFVNNPSGFEKLTDEDAAALASLEELRSCVIGRLVEFSDACRDADCRTIAEALYALLTGFGVERAVAELYDRLEEQGLTAEADEEVRVYNLTIDALDRIVAAAGEDRLTLKRFREYLDYMFMSLKFSDIPRYQDQVAVGIADRVRLSSAGVVFVIGAVDGVFPSIPQTAGAFSEVERRILIENDIPLSDSLEELSCHEKYIAYCALTSASDKLFVTTYSGDLSGEKREPSVIMTEIERLFPNRVHNFQSACDEELFTRLQAFEYLSRRYGDNTPKVAALRKFFYSDDDFRPLMEKIDGLIKNEPRRINNPQTAEKLFGRNINVSASQIEKYNECAFKYFCNYGLRAKELRTASLDQLQFGNVVHYALERFLTMYEKSVLNSLTQDEIRDAVNTIMDDYARETFGGTENKSAAFPHLVERLKINIIALINQLIRQLSYSDFVPTDYELKIGRDGAVPSYTLALGDDRSVSVNGFIDRVDLYKDEKDKTYVRIVDYKTGNKTFTLSEILYGINMQMLIYLRAVCENGGDYYGDSLAPAGVLYMPASAPVIDGDKTKTAEEITKFVDGKMSMNGFVLNDAELLNHMDRSGSFIKKGSKPVDGKYSDTYADDEQMQLVFRHIDATIRKMGAELLSGNVGIKPLKGIKDGCEYCPFDSVCLRTADGAYRYGSKVNAKTIYEKLSEEGAESDE